MRVCVCVLEDDSRAIRREGVTGEVPSVKGLFFEGARLHEMSNAFTDASGFIPL